MTDKIIRIVGEVLEIEINENTSQKNCSKWDSMRHLNIVIALEDAFDVFFEPEDIAQMESIASIEEIIKAYLNLV